MEQIVAGQRQAEGIEQIGHTIDDMDQMPQQNSALVEEASAAAKSLAEQTEQLSGALAQFKLATGQALGVPSGRARLALAG
jgi:methyl-accepting chemotaxis protein